MNNEFYNKSQEVSKLTRPEKESKVYNLVLELAEAQRGRKSTMKGFTEEIKRIKLEIADLVNPDVEMVEV